MTLFRASTGEAWNSIMDDMVRGISPIYICKDIYDYDTFEKENKEIRGCGVEIAIPFMISF